MSSTSSPDAPPPSRRGGDGEVIRVLLVEDSPVALALLKRGLAGFPDIQVVGTAGHGEQALALIPTLDPHVICTDLHMPVMDGLEFSRAVMERYPRPILVISISVQEDDKQNIFQLFEAGVLDVFPKPMAWITHGQEGGAGVELVRKIRALANIGGFPKRSPATPPEREEALLLAPAQAVNMVVIGSSLGGPQVLREILAALPVDFPAPIVCIQHLDEVFQEDLVQWLGQYTEMPVRVAENGEVPMPGSVYFPPVGHHLLMDTHGRLIASNIPPVEGHRPSITVAMESVATHFGGATVGVLLSGLGRDGVRGLAAISMAGGVTMVQDQATAMVYDLPRQAIEMGAARHILPSSRMAEALLALTGKTETDRQKALDEPIPVAGGIKVLVVEDSPTQAFKMKRLLQEQGYDVTVARDGLEGLEMAQAVRPRLVVSDVSMPRMDGFELCRALKNHSLLATMPVILVTALTSPSEILEGLGAGADNYLTKPYDEAYLLGRVQALLDGEGSNDPVAESAGDLDVLFEGRSYRINSTRRQILNLLLATYQKTVQQNKELVDKQMELKMLNLQLVDQSAKQELLNQQLKGEIGERERVEERQRQLLKEMEGVNKELADFAYIVSHDLKAPVRAIGSLTSWLLNDYVQQLDEGGRDLVNLLATRAHRMNDLIEAILQYTEVSRVHEHIQPVNLQRLVGRVLQELKPPEGIEVQVHPPLPTIHFDNRRAEQLFVNLIGNALRFMDKPRGEIHVGWREDPDHWEFHVADNGPGIDEKYHRKIFNIFQTLQPRDEMETAGVGLALVRKIVDKYGGRVWVESAPGKGSVFRFALPKEPSGMPGSKNPA